MFEPQAEFLHRPNLDDSYTSICVRCFGTAGSGREGKELESQEKSHVCRKQALRARAAMSDEPRVVETPGPSTPGYARSA
ncbi:MAG: hypothetical protein M3O31_10180 [Acidobacteriota bacterium]|nr:hypothetical protein [Acidobacteriota bacterium]